MVLLSFAAFACRPSSDGAPQGDLPDPEKDVNAIGVDADLQNSNEDAVSPKRTAVLAGGCFWCVEAVFEQLEGVEDVQSGYAGGSEETARYKLVATGSTKHAEAIRIVYDPTQITYGQLLKVFFSTHDPTQLNRQGPDTGPQYRSAVFYANEEQKHVAQAYIEQLKQSGQFDDPIVTTLEPLTGFFPAEDYHQDYAKNNTSNPYIQVHAMPKVEKVKKKFADQLKKDNGQQ